MNELLCTMILLLYVYEVLLRCVVHVLLYSIIQLFKSQGYRLDKVERTRHNDGGV